MNEHVSAGNKRALTTSDVTGRFVLTAMGWELLFDMFGQGAADCA